jgi:ABC-type transporter Mla MlaB component
LAGASATRLYPTRQGAQQLRQPRTIELGFDGTIDRADIPELCERVRLALEAIDADWLDCNVGDVLLPDAVTVEALARLQLTARRSGSRVRLRDASPELCDLLEFMGLSEILLSQRSAGAGRQAEEWEERGRVEEEADPGDLPV